MTTTWRAFIGDGICVTLDGPELERADYAHLNRRGLTWEQARDLLVPDLERAHADMATVCDGCADTALAALQVLRGTAGTEVADCEVDGEAYLLLREPNGGEVRPEVNEAIGREPSAIWLPANRLRI